MSRRLESQFLLPASERGWEWWTAKECLHLERLSEYEGRGAFAFGVPMSACTTFVSTFPKRIDEALLPEMVRAQIEKRGLQSPAGQETVMAHQYLEEGSEGIRVAIDVLAPDFSEDLCLGDASRYAPAGRFFRLPDQKLVLVREQGRYGIWAGVHGRLSHSQYLTAGEEIHAGVAQEIQLLAISLEGLGDPVKRRALEVWAPLSEEEVGILENGLTIPVEMVEAPQPELSPITLSSGPMLPPTVVEAHAMRASRQRLRIGLLALAAFYAFVTMALLIWNQQQQRKVMALEDRIDSRRDRVRFIQGALERSRTLAPAYDKSFFPIVQLARVTQLLPPSGVKVLKFITRDQEIRIEGLAREPQLAFQLKEDLEKDKRFGGYSWEMANPRVNSNNSASFVLQGEYAGAN
ncbi:MAG: hypothetical protein AAF191_20025 [Verrucomicrobiota bacterium]